MVCTQQKIHFLMNKTAIYVCAIVVLLGLNLLLFFSSGDAKGKDVSSPFFENLNFNEISAISFNSTDYEIDLKRGQNGWLINEADRADQGFVNTLLSVFERVESGRSVELDANEKLGDVELTLEDGSKSTFSFASNLNRTKSYFLQDGKAREVAVPGYKDNVVDIFLLHPDQWKDRLIIDASWRSIQHLRLDVGGQKKLEIAFDDKFFLVEGQPPVDSSAVVDYLNQFQYFEANELISKGRFPQFDSLSTEEPLALLSIDDFKLDATFELVIYPAINNQPYHLVKRGDQMMVIDARRIKGLLASSEDFLGQ